MKFISLLTFLLLQVTFAVASEYSVPAGIPITMEGGTIGTSMGANFDGETIFQMSDSPLFFNGEGLGLAAATNPLTPATNAVELLSISMENETEIDDDWEL